MDKEAGTVTVKVTDDNYVAAVIMLDAEEKNTLETKAVAEETKGAETELTFEYPEDATLVKFVATDYATNESEVVTAFVEEPTYVTIYFSHPEGTELDSLEEEYVAYVGESVTLPGLTGEVEGYTFGDIWSPEELDDMEEDTLILYYMYGLMELYFTEDKLTVTEDMDGMTLYAVYWMEEVIEGVERTEEPIQGFYFESQEDADAWTFVDQDGDGFNWKYINNTTQPEGESYSAYEGDGLIASASWDADGGALNPDNWAISPAIDLTAAEKASVSIWAVGQDSDYCEENFAIYAGETADPDAMTKVSDDFVATGLYTNYVADLSAFAGKTVYVAVRHYDCTDQFELNVDAVEVFDSVVDIAVAASSTVYYTTNPVPGGETPVDPTPVGGYVLSTELKDGDKVVIYNADAGMALSNADSDAESNPERYRLGVATTPVDDAIAEPAEGTVWTVEITDDGVAFKDADGKYLSTNSYGNLILNGEFKFWSVNEAATANSVYLLSTEAKGNQGDPRGIEFYQAKFTTFYASETNLANSQAAFALQLYVLSAEEDELPVVS